MDLATRLRTLVDALPSDASVTLTTACLRAWLEEDGGTSDQVLPGELTLEAFAEAMGRAPSTVRGWLNRGLVPGSYRLRGKAWRIPLAAIRAFREREAAGQAFTPPSLGRGRAPALGAWRQVRSRSAG